MRKCMRACLAYVCVERSKRAHEKKDDTYLGEETDREEKIASIRGNKTERKTCHNFETNGRPY